MDARPERSPSPSGYLLKFGLTAAVLVGLTLVLVLVVLPRRYVLHAGLRESGMSFPTGTVAFTPPAEQRRQARPLPPAPPPLTRGPAELFWAQVSPYLVEGGDLGASLPLFADYLRAHPDDRSVWREFAVTLERGGRSAEAVPVWRHLLSGQDDPPMRLALARTLRDMGRWEEASAEYAQLSAQRPGDAPLALEWARALAWARQYDRAGEILAGTLVHEPTSNELRVELVRTLYASGRVPEAARVLAELTEEDLVRLGAAELRDGVMAALPPAPAPPPPPLSARERAERAVAEEDFEGAAALYREALAESPEDSSAWRGYADLLQYQLDDLEGAREALLRVEALGATDSAFRFRLAQVELWSGRADQAEARLQALADWLPEELLAAPPPDSTGFGVAQAAEVRALLGDLARWRGDMVRSANAYGLALHSDSANVRARQGLEELHADWDRNLAAEEAPGLRGAVYSLGDSDDFARLDLGVEGSGTRGDWAWGVRGGTRSLEGVDLQGASGTEQGPFLELEAARWWRWGTLRTGVSLGMEGVRPGETDLSLGASLRWPSLGGFRATVRYEHGPAYPLTTTLQSVYAGVTQDRLSANLARQIWKAWSLTVAADATRVSAREAEWDEGGEAVLRAETGVSLGRSLGGSLVVGINTRALTYSAAAPRAGDLSLFWDPRGLVSGGIFAQVDHELAQEWRLRARLNPALAFIDERRGEEWERVPHFSAEAGLSYQGRYLRTTLDGFYYQGRFDGYQAYGARLTFSVHPGGGQERAP